MHGQPRGIDEVEEEFAELWNACLKDFKALNESEFEEKEVRNPKRCDQKGEGASTECISSE